MYVTSVVCCYCDWRVETGYVPTCCDLLLLLVTCGFWVSKDVLWCVVLVRGVWRLGMYRAAVVCCYCDWRVETGYVPTCCGVLLL
jgi:hypothetical protein